MRNAHRPFGVILCCYTVCFCVYACVLILYTDIPSVLYCTFPFLCVQVVKSTGSDQVTVVGAGVTVHEALKAAEELAAAGVNVQVIDPFTIKPIDKEGLIRAVRATGGRLVVVEDHYPEGRQQLDIYILLFNVFSLILTNSYYLMSFAKILFIL